MRKYGVGLFLALLVIAAAFMIYIKIHPKELPPNLVEGVGRFDADVINLAAKYPGRITAQFARDSMQVHKGQILTQLSSKELQAKKEALEHQIEAKKHELAMLHNLLPEKVKEADAFVKASSATLKALKQEIKALQALVKQDMRDYKRLKNLYAKQLIQKQKVELAHLKLKTDRQKLLGLQEQKKALLAKVEAAQSTLKEAQSTLTKIDILAQAIKALQAQKEAVQASIEELTLRSPIDGVVLEKIANVGEILPAGGISATLLDPKELYLKIFIDTIKTGKVKVGDKAVIFLDAYPNKPFAAKVIRVAKKAEFTPKEVAVRSDRIQRVYAVHIKPLEPNALFKLGLPAIGVISLDGKDLPKSLKEIPQL